MKPSKCSLLPDILVHAGTVFWLCIRNILSTVIPASGTRHTDRIQKTLSSCSPSPTRCLPCLPTKGTYAQAQPALQLTQISPAQIKDLETTHPQPARDRRAPPGACISRTVAASPCPLHTSPTPFPDQMTPLASKRRSAPWLSTGW